MAVVRYTARRSLIGGHSAGTAYQLDLKLALTGGLTRSRATTQSVHVAISGQRETVHLRTDIAWAAQSIPLAGSNALAIIEFLDSVEEGEAFEFSPYQVAADTPTYRDVQLAATGYTETRANPIGGSGKGANDFFVYGFSIVELP